MAKKPTKNQAAVELGRLGGLVSGIPKGLAVMDAKKRKAAQDAGRNARWAAYYAANPDKLAAKQARAAAKKAAKKAK